MIAFLLLCCVTATYGELCNEFVNVTDPELIKQGYSCLPSNPIIGPMRNGQTASEYSKTLCEMAICGYGWVEYHQCGTAELVGLPNCKLVEDLTKPYPECCAQPECS